MASGMDLLELLVGGGQGFVQGRNEGDVRDVNLRRALLEREALQGRLQEQADESAFRGQELGLRREEMGLKERELEMMEEYRDAQSQAELAGEEEIIPGGLDINIGGKPFKIPGKRNTLKEFLPYIREMEERQFMEKNPRFYERRSGGDDDKGISDKDMVNFRLQLMREVYGNPTLGEQPGSRKAAYEEMLGIAQRDPVLTKIFGAPTFTPLEQFIQAIQDDPRFSTYEDAQMQLKQMQATNPNAYKKLEPYLEELEQYFAETLPSRNKRTSRGPMVPGEAGVKVRPPY